MWIKFKEKILRTSLTFTMFGVASKLKTQTFSVREEREEVSLITVAILSFINRTTIE